MRSSRTGSNGATLCCPRGWRRRWRVLILTSHRFGGGNPFCEAKSELKFFEAALVDVPTIAYPRDRSGVQFGTATRVSCHYAPRVWCDHTCPPCPSTRIYVISCHGSSS